jgi:hypothetical protein
MSTRITKASADDALPIVSLTAEPLTAIAENGTQKAAFVIRLSKAAPAGGVLVNLNGFDTDGQSGDETITTENINLLNLGAGNTPASVLIKPGAKEARIILTPVADNVAEGEETTFLSLRSGRGYTVDPVQNSASTTITDLPIVSVTAEPTSPVAEDSNQAQTFIFKLSKPAPSNGLTLNVNAFESDQQAGDASVGLNNITNLTPSANGGFSSLTIAPGATEARLTLTPISDNVTEGEETTFLTLNSGNGYSVDQTKRSASVTQTDLPIVSITADPTTPIREDGKESASFIIKLSKAAPAGGLTLSTKGFDTDGKAGDVTITTTGIADLKVDAASNTPTSLTIAPGATEARVTLTPKKDSEIEGTETSFLAIQEGDKYTVNPSQSLAGIDITDGGVLGTDDNDDLTGTGGKDSILGLGGDDLITGLRGADLLDGGTGKNEITSGKGRDRILLNRDGLAIVTDFQDKQDRLALPTGITLGSIRISQRDDDVLVRSGNKQVAILEGIDVDLISKAGDFVKV